MDWSKLRMDYIKIGAVIVLIGLVVLVWGITVKSEANELSSEALTGNEVKEAQDKGINAFMIMLVGIVIILLGLAFIITPHWDIILDRIKNWSGKEEAKEEKLIEEGVDDRVGLISNNLKERADSHNDDDEMFTFILDERKDEPIEKVVKALGMEPRYAVNLKKGGIAGISCLRKVTLKELVSIEGINPTIGRRLLGYANK